MRFLQSRVGLHQKDQKSSPARAVGKQSLKIISIFGLSFESKTNKLASLTCASCLVYLFLHLQFSNFVSGCSLCIVGVSLANPIRSSNHTTLCSLSCPLGLGIECLDHRKQSYRLGMVCQKAVWSEQEIPY